MDFVTTVIIIGVTALTDLLVVGVLGIWFKRSIERSFEEHIERYKSELQKELVEHQTRFVRNHEKASETLEKLYRDFSGLSQSMLRHILSLIPMCAGYSTATGQDQVLIDLAQATQNCSTQVSEIFSYWKQNDLYLPSDINNQIQVIYKKSSAYITSISLLNTFIMHGFPVSEVDYLNILVRDINVIYGVTIPKIEANGKSVQAFLDVIQKDMIESKKALEALYKREANLT